MIAPAFDACLGVGWMVRCDYDPLIRHLWLKVQLGIRREHWVGR